MISNIGDSLYILAVLWLVHDLTGSGMLTGFSGVVLLFPQTLQMAFGPLVDGYRVKKVLFAVHLFQGLVVFLLGIALFTREVHLGMLLAVVAVLSVSAQLVDPAQTKAIKQLLSDEELASANSVMSIAYEGVDIVFNVVGGIVIAVFGSVAVFFVDSVTFVVAALLFYSLSIENSRINRSEFSIREYVSDVRRSVSFISGSFLRDLVLTSFLVNFSMGVAMVTLPFFASNLGNSVTYGLLVSSMVAGMLLGSLGSEYFFAHDTESVIATGFFVTASSWGLAAVASHPIASPALFFLAWVPIGIYTVAEETLVQKATPTERLGKVRSTANSLSTLSLPIGALAGGALIDTVGSETTMATVAVGFALVTLYYLVNPALRGLPAVAQQRDGTAT